MDKIVIYITVFIGFFALIYGFEKNLYFSAFLSFVVVVLVFIGYKIENYIKSNGNKILNKVVYFFTRSDKKYNVLHKHCTYTCLKENQYTFKKEYEILPKCSDLDRINDRFAWSAPSNGCKIMPTKTKHSINKKWLQESWTCYSIYFNEQCKKDKSYYVGSEISDLIDTTNTVVPFLSNTIDRKTKRITLEVVFSNDLKPKKAKFESFSSKYGLSSNYEEELAYDSDIRGFKKTIEYPRKGWRYVISWDEKI